MNHRLVLLLLCACIAFPVSASAAGPGHWYLGPQLSYIDLDHNRDDFTPQQKLHDTYYFGLGAGYQFNPDWALEFSAVTDLKSDMSAKAYSLNGFRFFGDGWRPFLSAGVSHFQIDDVKDEDTDQVQIGAGLSRFVSDRLEARLWAQYMYDVGYFSHHDVMVSFGLNYHFGELRKTAAPAEPAPQPQPESVRADEEVLETVELLVEFDTDKHFVRSVYQPQFDRIGRILRQNPQITFTIEGHADWRHTEEYNQALSERRAEAVKHKLVRDYGIDAARITTIGYGELRPIATNQTEEGMQRNRRAVAVFKRKRPTPK